MISKINGLIFLLFPKMFFFGTGLIRQIFFIVQDKHRIIDDTQMFFSPISKGENTQDKQNIPSPVA